MIDIILTVAIGLSFGFWLDNRWAGLFAAIVYQLAARMVSVYSDRYGSDR